ncbi:MAG TPA: hypothetical protein VKV35_00175, partial [Streptosporangiaceae bacterium]|nr:hypothetical protein [Streptosporangiaceae bacterium]
LLVMLVALDGRPEWLAFAAGGYYSAEAARLGPLVVPGRLHNAVAYGVPVLVVAVGWLVRRQIAGRAACRPQIQPEPVSAPADRAAAASLRA